MATAKLILKDGTTLLGESFGADVSSAGEVVFNTGMMGYPESMTDPSYQGQILTLTYPLVGNYGIGGECKDKDRISKRFESSKIQIKGLVVSEYSENYSHWDANKSLSEWLKLHKIPAITGIDTRALTRKIRKHGTILGKLIIEKKSKKSQKEPEDFPFYNPDEENQVAKVSPKKPKTYKRGKKRIICVDCGMKNNILRSLLDRNITVIRTPWDYDFIEAGEKFDGIFMSNGPGDPAILTPLHEIMKKALKLKKPIFGICLGTQILALAAGAKTHKLPFGHRSQNQPCIDTKTGHCYITSQNHGFAINEKSLPPGWEVWLRNTNDNSIEGIRHKRLPYKACQFHPEATPGPTDTEHFFDEFVKTL